MQVVGLRVLLFGNAFASSLANQLVSACNQQHTGAKPCIASGQPAPGDVLLQSWQIRHSSQEVAGGAQLLPPEGENVSVDFNHSDAGNLPELRTEAAEPALEGSSRASDLASQMGDPVGVPSKDYGENITSWNVSVRPREQPYVVMAVHMTVASMLLLFVGFIMTLFYLINFPDEDIRIAAWKLLSRTLCIFLAVLISKSTTKVVLNHAVRISLPSDKISEEMSAVYEQHDVVSTREITVSFVCWIMLWLIFQTYMGLYRGEHIVAISKLGGHIVAFAGLDAFTALQSGEPPLDILRKTWMHSAVCDVAVGITVWTGLECAEKFRKYMVRNHCANPENLKEWLHECREAESEAASLILGLLLSATIRHSISGQHPPLHGGKPKSKTNDDVFLLLAVAVGLGAFVMRLEMFLKVLLDDIRPGVLQRRKKGVERVIRVVVDTASMTMAWCLLYWGEWFIYNWTNDEGVGHGDRMTALLVVAAVLSAVCFACIFIIEFASRASSTTANIGLHALGTALGLVVGCAWEDVFIEAVGGVKMMKILKLSTMNSTLLVIFMLCAITLPAWMLYILPQAERGHHAQHAEHGKVTEGHDTSTANHVEHSVWDSDESSDKNG